MAISFQAIGQKIVSFAAASGLTAGKPCIVSANETVSLSANGKSFCGVVQNVKDGVAGVIVSGCVTLPYSGAAAPTVGYCGLCADGNGGVTAASDGRSYLVVGVDTTAKTVEFFL